MSKDDCIPCDKKKEESIFFPDCPRCGKPILTEDEYEELANIYIHKLCYDEALLGIILSAPSLEEVTQLQSMRKMMQNFMPGFVMQNKTTISDEDITNEYLKKFSPEIPEEQLHTLNETIKDLNSKTGNGNTSLKELKKIFESETEISRVMKLMNEEDPNGDILKEHFRKLKFDESEAKDSSS